MKPRQKLAEDRRVQQECHRKTDGILTPDQQKEWDKMKTEARKQLRERLRESRGVAIDAVTPEHV